MTENELKDFSIYEIVQDFKSILDCLQTCVFNNVGAAIFQGFNPYLCSFVYSGYEYLEKQKMILVSSDNSFKKMVSKSRSKFLKQYASFNQSTYKSLNNFNKKEYYKFFYKTYPNKKPYLTRDISNYYIASINDKPIDNYHLSSGILGCEIGSYIDDITPQVQSFIYQMISFIGQILSAAHICVESKTQKVMFDEVKYADINLAYKYTNFGIQDNPPLLMAFMDILCTVNSYNEIFVNVNVRKGLDLKVKYLVLFESIQGIKKIFEFCTASKINLNVDEAFCEFIALTDKSYCKNLLRRYCAHYGYKETEWKNNPVVEAFEKHFNKPIDDINSDLSEKLWKLGDYLNKFVIRVPFASRLD